jgi:hypothetical protein
LVAGETEHWIAAVAKRLGDLREHVVFVGGAILGLLIDDPGGSAPRPTDDLDVVMEISSRTKYHAVEAQLRTLGFRPDTSEGAPLCRWRVDDIVVDIIPTAEEILGFTNRWYSDAMHAAITVNIEPGLPVRIATGPYFIAMKLEAFAGRGGGDFVASHDLEDIISVVDGHVNIEQEVRTSKEDLQEYLVDRVGTLLDDPEFVAAVPGHLPGDEASQARVPFVLERLRKIARR